VVVAHRHPILPATQWFWLERPASRPLKSGLLSPCEKADYKEPRGQTAASMEHARPSFPLNPRRWLKPMGGPPSAITQPDGPSAVTQFVSSDRNDLGGYVSSSSC
jgi:hypothetical protein